MARIALRPRNPNVCYTNPRLSPSPVPVAIQTVKKTRAKRQRTDNHSTVKTAELQPIPLSVEEILQASINAESSVPSDSHPKSSKKRQRDNEAIHLQNASQLPDLPSFTPMEHTQPLHKAYNRLPAGISQLDSLEPSHIFDLFLNEKILQKMVDATNSYAAQYYKGLETDRIRDWSSLTKDELRVWLGIQIHMGVIGIDPAHYWRQDGLLFGVEGLPPSRLMSQTRFENIKAMFHITSPDDSSKSPKISPSWHHKVDPLLEQLRSFSQTYRVPASSITIDEAMILFTGRSVHITKMPNKPIGQRYKFFCLADRGYVWDFHPSSNALGLDPVCAESNAQRLSDTGKMVHHLLNKLHQKYRRLSWTCYMDNFFTSQPLFAELRRMGIGACGTARQSFKGFPQRLKVPKNIKLPYHHRSGVVEDGVATLLWMDNAPVTMMTNIHPLSGDSSLISNLRNRPGDKSSNAAGVSTAFNEEERQKELLIPVIVHMYNQHKVGVDVADQYRTYYDTQLTTRRNWYPIFYWILETALINSLIIYRNTPGASEYLSEHINFRLSIAEALLIPKRGSTIEISSFRGAANAVSQDITRPTNDNNPLHPPPPQRQLNEHTPLPLSRVVPAPHCPVLMTNRVECFLCRWKKVKGMGGKGMQTSIKCENCNQPLCFNKERNCFYELHHM